MKRPLATLSLVTGLALVATASCTSPSKGALVLAISTDMETPKDLDVVSVFITTNSVVKFDYLGRVLPDGSVALPATLAVVEPDAPNAQVRIRVIGFQEQTARVLRDVLTTVPHDQRSLLRLPLNFLDDGSGQGSLPANLVPLGPGGAPEGDTTFDPDMVASSCDFGQQLTSVNGACVTAVVDSSTLPPYDPADVYGDGGLQANGAPTTCFDVATCFADAMPVTAVDLATCSFSLSAQGAAQGSPVETVDASAAPARDASIGVGGGPAACSRGGISGSNGNAGLCLPRTCADYPTASCGPQSDGCGGVTASCGTCPSPQFCGGGGPSTCGGNSGVDPQCAPTTCAALGGGCGPAPDGCGGVMECGSCTAPQTCGGGGTPGVCGSPPPSGCGETETCGAHAYVATCGSDGSGTCTTDGVASDTRYACTCGNGTTTGCQAVGPDGGVEAVSCLDACNFPPLQTGAAADAGSAPPGNASDDAGAALPLPSFDAGRGGAPVALATLNLALVTPNTGACTAEGRCFVPLENDPKDGWTVSGDTVQMLPGICAKLKNGAQLYMSSGTCGAKALSLPVCEPTGGASAGGSVIDAGGDFMTSDASVASGAPDASGSAGKGSVSTGGIACGTSTCDAATQVCCLSGGGGGGGQTSVCTPIAVGCSSSSGGNGGTSTRLLGTPTFSPPSGTTFSGSGQVAIIPPTGFPDGGTIFYTTDGKTTEMLLGPIDVSQTETIQAYASAPGYPNSATAMAVYIVTPGGADAGLDAGLGPDDAGPVDALP